MNWRGFVLGLLAVGLSGISSEAQVSLPDGLPDLAPQGQYEQQGQYKTQSQYSRPNEAEGRQGQSGSFLPGWQRIGIPGVFSAAMPGHPRSREVSAQGGSATCWDSDSSEPMHLFSVEMQHCGRVSGKSMDEVLFSLMNARAKTVGAQPTHKRRIESQGSPGCMFDMVTGDTEWNCMIRVVNDKVITMLVCSMPGQGNDQDVQQFFNSFSL